MATNNYLERNAILKQGHRDSISRVRLGRDSNVGGRGGGGRRIHESISHVRLGRSSDAKTARNVTDGLTDTAR